MNPLALQGAVELAGRGGRMHRGGVGVGAELRPDSIPQTLGFAGLPFLKVRPLAGRFAGLILAVHRGKGTIAGGRGQA